MPLGELRGYLSRAVEENVMLNWDESSSEALCPVSLDAFSGSSEAHGPSVEPAEPERLWSDTGSWRLRGNAFSFVAFDDSRLQRGCRDEGLTLQQYLRCQCTPQNEDAFREVVDCLDEYGYFQGDVEAIAFGLGCSPQVVSEELERVRALEPRGVGATSVRECLQMQLDPRGRLYNVLYDIIDRRFEDIPHLKAGAIARMYSVSREDGRRILRMLRELDPHPGQPFASVGSVAYEVPDIVVRRGRDGRFLARFSLSDTAGLTMDSEYQRLAGSLAIDGDTRSYLAQKQSQASALLRDLSFRHRTIDALVGSIIVRQQHFFETGGASMETMSVREVADELGVHPSTVSRALAGKTMGTPFGTYPLSIFFKAGVTSCDGEGDSESEGEAVATFQVKTMLKRLIDDEDKSRPHSDSSLRKALADAGVKIERRTVAKYRDSLGIPCSSERRRLYARRGEGREAPVQ